MKKPSVNKTTTQKGLPSWDRAKAMASKIVNPKTVSPAKKKGGR